MKREYYDELRCRGCGKQMNEDTPLHDTGWRGVHWCGSEECAVKIMKDTCEEMDPEDDCHYEMVPTDDDYDDVDENGTPLDDLPLENEVTVD